MQGISNFKSSMNKRNVIRSLASSMGLGMEFIIPFILYLACEFKMSPAKKAVTQAMSNIITNQVSGCGFFMSKMS